MNEIVRVAVAAPVLGTFDYAVPAVLRGRLEPGMRVIVPFGSRRAVGFVVGAGERAAGGAALKEVASVSDGGPLLDASLLRVLTQVAGYYLAPPGETLRAALPAGARSKVRRFLALTGAGRAWLEGGDASLLPALRHRALPEEDRALLERCRKGGVELDPLVRRGRGAAERVRRLRSAGLIELVAEVVTRSHLARTETVARAVGTDGEAMLARAPRRRALLEHLRTAGRPVPLTALHATFPDARAQLRALSERGLVQLEERPREDQALDGGGAPVEPLLAPNAAQASAIAGIGEAIDRGGFAPFLLFGVTGSGKTEVYQHTIARGLAAGRAAIVLVPEISLTPQLTRRFRAHFGDRVAILHSALSDAERLGEWRRLREGKARIALGARSAVFAPVADLGIVVVDEEHDGSFKQEEGVRYHARDVALLRGKDAGAVVLLGSATPSLESFHGARGGRMGLLELPHRATPQALPAVETVDLRRYRVGADLLSAPLAQALESTLKGGEQAILFLNRRGFDASMLCTDCGEPLRCRDCSVALTHHRRRGQLVCHYCGFSIPVPRACAACGGSALRPLGAGTEKIETALRQRFQGARVARLDRDTAGGERLHAILGAMRERRIDILVGTQMVTKGHDFPGVTLVGVLLADVGLGLPDLRASERTFQLLSQVAGRAGRGDKPGRVLVQTYSPAHPSITFAARHDYVGFYEAEVAARRELGYPPFGRLIGLWIDGVDPAAVERSARRLGERAAALARGTSVGLLGPVEAPIARIRGRTRWQLFLRGPERGPLRGVARALLDEAGGAGVRVTVDVDPTSTL